MVSHHTKFWRIPELGDLEVIHASYTDHAFPRHVHEEYVIGAMVSGSERISHRGDTYDVRAGDVIMINPFEPHANYSVNGKSFSYRTFYPEAELIRNLLADESNGDRPPRLDRMITTDRPLAKMLLRFHFELETRSSTLEIQSRFVSIFGCIFERYASVPVREQVGSERYYVKTVRDYIDAHFKDNISLSGLSLRTGRSSFHLLRTFRKEVGLAPCEYQTQLRIAHARKLLKKGRPILETGLEVGFADQSHFTRQFKRLTGVTPGQYVRESNIVQDRTN